MVKISKSILRTGIPRYWQEIVYPLFASVVLYFCDGNTRNDYRIEKRYCFFLFFFLSLIIASIFSFAQIIRLLM